MSLLALRRRLLHAFRRPSGWLGMGVLVAAMVLAFLQSDRMHTHPGAGGSAALAASAVHATSAWCFVDHDRPTQAAGGEDHAHDAGQLAAVLPPSGLLKVAAGLPDAVPPPFVLLPQVSAVAPPPQRPPIA